MFQRRDSAGRNLPPFWLVRTSPSRRSIWKGVSKLSAVGLFSYYKKKMSDQLNWRQALLCNLGFACYCAGFVALVWLALLGAAAQVCSRLFRHDLGQPSMRRVQQGADATSQTVGGGRQAGAADFASHPRVTAPVLGNRKPGHRPAQAPPLHGWLALAGCQLLHLRLPLSQAHQGLGQLGLDARATRAWHWRLPL